MPESIQVPVGDSSVTALVYAAPDPAPPHPTVILAHGAGLPQTSPFMVDFAKGLARRGCQAVTFNFPYTEQHRRLPDRAPVLEGCFREVVAAVRARPVLATGPLVIGGKSMGGRMATHLAAQGLADLAGVVVLGYPLHPPGRPQQRRAEHQPRAAGHDMGDNDAGDTRAEGEPGKGDAQYEHLVHHRHGGVSPHAFGLISPNHSVRAKQH